MDVSAGDMVRLAEAADLVEDVAAALADLQVLQLLRRLMMGGAVLDVVQGAEFPARLVDLGGGAAKPGSPRDDSG